MKNDKGVKIAKRLASYSAVAACLLSTGFNAAAQCGTATVGAPLPVDIDGDGTDDINIIATNFPGPYGLASGTVTTALPNFTTATSFTFTATVVPPGPGTSWYGCITTFYNGGFTGIDPNATAMGPISVTGSINYYNVALFSVYQYFYSVNAGFATGGGNQIVGLSASGSDVCAAIAGGLATVNIGTCFNISSSYYQFVAAGFSSMLYPMGTVTLDHPPCTTAYGNYYAGLFQSLMFLDGTYTNPGPYLINGPNYYGPNFVSQSCIPGSTFIGVEFAGGDGTQYGWVEVTYNTDGSITCVNTGYNGCSVEEVALANGAAGVDECIAVGAPTVNTANEACSPCEITSLGLAAGVCDNAGTTANNNSTDGDDTFMLTIDPVGTGIGTTYTVSGGASATGTYGTPLMISLPADGSNISITVTDDANTTCTFTESITAPMACSTLQCTLTSAGLMAGACDNAGTTALDDSADGDDTFMITINPTGVNTGTTYTISGSVSGVGTYGTPFTMTLPADGANISVTIADDSDPNCTITEAIMAPAACSSEDCDGVLGGPNGPDNCPADAGSF